MRSTFADLMDMIQKFAIAFEEKFKKKFVATWNLGNSRDMAGSKPVFGTFLAILVRLSDFLFNWFNA